MTVRRDLRRLGICALATCAVTVFAQQGAADEEVARRQLESGRAFARQGNYAEAIKDFRAVADTHGSTSVADDALLEIARYSLDVAGDPTEAAAAVDTLLKKYPTSDSAPDAYNLSGRLALARSHQSADLDAALANFDRVARLFPGASAVPRSLQLAGEALWYAGRYGEALANLSRVEAEFPANTAAAAAYMTEANVLVSLGDPLLAMEELQQCRNRWPTSPEAAAALTRITLLHRLYVRAKGGPAFTLSPTPVGPAKLENVIALALTAKGSLHWASDAALGTALPANAGPLAGAFTKPRGLSVDAAGTLTVLDVGQIKPIGGKPLSLALPRNNSPQVEPLKALVSAGQLSNGDWLVMDDDQKAIHRFSRAGAYGGVFAPVRVSRLAVNALDEVAGIDRDQKSIVLFDPAGKSLGRLPLKGTGYEIQNPQDLAFDALGHLYVLDRGAIAIFSPYPAERPATAATRAPASAERYRLLALFAEPDRNPGAFRRATAFAVDPSGTVYLYDDRAQRILVYQ